MPGAPPSRAHTHLLAIIWCAAAASCKSKGLLLFSSGLWPSDPYDQRATLLVPPIARLPSILIHDDDLIPNSQFFSNIIRLYKNFLLIFFPGQVFSQNLRNRLDLSSSREGPKTADNNYLGYSLAIGDFTGNGRADVAVGMPRSANLTGKVRSWLVFPYFEDLYIEYLEVLTTSRNCSNTILIWFSICYIC